MSQPDHQNERSSEEMLLPTQRQRPMLPDGVAAQTAVIVPTYNESGNIERLTQELLGVLDSFRIVIVDDNSPDGTGEIAQKLTDTHERVSVVRRPGKLGLGTAYRDGFQHAIEQFDAKYLFSMDADFSHNPIHIPEMLSKVGDADMVVGSRYVHGGGTVDFGIDRQLISKTAQLFTHTFLGLQPLDCTSGFRCYRREVLQRVDPASIKSTGYSFLIEMLCRVEQEGFKVAESPIIYVAREHGLSKISSKEIIGAFQTIFRMKWAQLTGGLQ